MIEDLNFKKWLLLEEAKIVLSPRQLQKYVYAAEQATRRKKHWGLLPIDYIKIVEQPCHYCERLPVDKYELLGLDRLDNKKGYELSNVVPCCGRCNIVKGHGNLVSYSEMITIGQYFKEKEIRVAEGIEYTGSC